MSAGVSIKELLEAGAHFGHQVSRWNPKMRPYIFTTKGGVHILDLEQTVVSIQKACKFISDIVALGHHVLFVGTKKQAQPIVEAEAKRVGQFYVTNRWLGGLLTNFKTIKASIQRLEELEKKAASEDFEKYTKKERLTIQREIDKLNLIFSGIKTMNGLPACLFIVDSKLEETAKREAKRLKIPVIAIVDTNCNPEDVDFIIPANDDALRSIQIITKTIADACEEGSNRRQETLLKEKETGGDEKEEKPSYLAQERTISEKEKGRVYVADLKKKEGTPPPTSEEDLRKYSSSKAAHEEKP